MYSQASATPFAQFASPRHCAAFDLRRTTTSTGGIKTRCRGLCPSVLPAPLWSPCPAPPAPAPPVPPSFCLLLLAPFAFSLSFRYFFALFVYRECARRDLKTENRNLKSKCIARSMELGVCVCLCVVGAFNCSTVQIV